MQRASAFGRLPLVLRLIVPLDRLPRTISIARAIAVERSSGSPSQPCPKETMPSSTRSRWCSATAPSSRAVVSSATRACGDGNPASSSCSEMQPMQRALHFGETGRAASPRSRKTFCAVKQPYSREQSATCASTRFPGPARETALDRRLEFAWLQRCAAPNPHPRRFASPRRANDRRRRRQTYSRRAGAAGRRAPRHRTGEANACSRRAARPPSRCARPAVRSS